MMIRLINGLLPLVPALLAIATFVVLAGGTWYLLKTNDWSFLGGFALASVIYQGWHRMKYGEWFVD